MGIVRAVCVSEKKGTSKHPVAMGEFVEDLGIAGDAHVLTQAIPWFSLYRLSSSPHYAFPGSDPQKRNSPRRSRPRSPRSSRPTMKQFWH